MLFAVFDGWSGSLIELSKYVVLGRCRSYDAVRDPWNKWYVVHHKVFSIHVYKLATTKW